MENWANKEAFFGASVPTEKITVPGLGDIRVHGLTCGEKDEYENTVMQFTAGDRQVRMSNARAVLLQMVVRDRHGNLMFGADDIGRLAALPAAIVDPILTVARRLSGMATGEIEDLVKNSDTGRGAEESGSGSESQTPKAGAAQK